MNTLYSVSLVPKTPRLREIQLTPDAYVYCFPLSIFPRVENRLHRNFSFFFSYVLVLVLVLYRTYKRFSPAAEDHGMKQESVHHKSPLHTVYRTLFLSLPNIPQQHCRVCGRVRRKSSVGVI